MTPFSILVSAAAAVLMTASIAQAQDSTRPMRLGASTPPPLGFIALCEDDLQACISEGTGQRNGELLDGWARRMRWERTFGDAGIVLAAPASEVHRTSESLPASTVLVAKNTRRKDGIRSQVKSQAKSFSGSSILDEIRLRDLEIVNRRINRAIRRASDQEVFGVADVWRTPSGALARGDCEDYALAKRRALIAAGMNPDRLTLAIVRTRRGEMHAVLLAALSDGEYVLDNLSPWVERWDRTSYEWVERQVSGTSLEWARIDTRS